MTKLGTVEHVFAGFGGQGVLFIGRVLAHAALNRNVNVSFIPSYGPEMRGGTANCKVVVSSKEVGSPLVEHPDVVIALNRPSLEKFEKTMKPKGTAIVNSSLIENRVTRDDVKAVYVPCNEIAMNLGHGTVVNLVALGAYLASQDFFTIEDIEEAIVETIGAKRVDMIDINKKCLRAGFDFVKSL